MRMHLIAAAAAICLAVPVSAGELDREFKGDDLKAVAKASKASSEKSVSNSELDKESPTQAWRHGGWGGWHGGWGWGGGYHGWGWGVGYHGWGGWGWGGYHGWGLSAYYWPSYSYFSSYYYPAVSYAYYPAWGYLSYGYPSYYCCW